MDEKRNSVKLGVYNIILNNKVVRNIPSGMGYVVDNTELPKYVDENPGFVAVQYGLKHMWQLKPNKTWESIV